MSLDRRSLLLLAPTLIAGCSVVDPKAADLYTLTSPREAGAGGARASWKLVVETPAASGALDTARIVSIRDRVAVEPFAGVMWTDRAPDLLRHLIVEGFERSGRVPAVGEDGAGVAADFLLKSELRDFQAEFDGLGGTQPTRVRVRLAVRLVSAPRREVEASESFEAVRTVAGADFRAVIAAFDEATRDLVARLVDWTIAAGERVRKGRGER